MEAIRNMSSMSERSEKSVKTFFGEYSVIDVTLSDESIEGPSASALLTIDKLLDNEGNRVIPGAKWKTMKVTIQKTENGWGKVTWQFP